MSNQRAQQQYPAVDQLGEALRVNLLRAARAHPQTRTRLSRGQRVGVLAAIGLFAVPGAIAVAAVIDSPQVDYQCRRAQPPPDADVRAGVPVDSVAPIAEEPPGTAPVNPCE
jgi:hypothetical protein